MSKPLDKSILIAGLCLLVGFSPAVASVTVQEQYRKFDESGRKNPGRLVGLRLDNLLAAKKYSVAKTQLMAQLKTAKIPKEMVHWRLAGIAISEKRFDDMKKHLDQTVNIPFLANAELARSVYDAIPKKEQDWLVHKLKTAGFFSKKTDSSCPYFDLVKRQKRAEFLYQLKKNHSLDQTISDQIFRELYIDLPEVVSAEDIAQLPDYAKLIGTLTFDDYKKRIEFLFLFGKNIEARATVQVAQQRKDFTAVQQCELRYEDAKVDRKLRKYAVAREKFVTLCAECPEEIQVKSRFMNLMLAAMMSDDTTLGEFDSFATDYPGHSFTDDVLMFKAGLLLGKRRIDDGLVELNKIINNYPDGDMIARALFLKAFTLAERRETANAITALQTLRKLSASESVEFAQAQYWILRLAVFNDLASHKNPNLDQLKKVKKDLYDLVYSRTPTVYSWLALLLLESVGEKVQKSTKVNAKDQIVSNNNPDLKMIELLVQHGFRSESLMLLDDTIVSADNIDNASVVARLFDMLNKPEAGHQKLVRCNAAVAHGLRKKIPSIFTRISYPRPFQKEVMQAVSQVNVPSSLVFSIMRQESGFLTHSRSWANARGLMQLIYSSAITQAKPRNIKNLKEDDLYLPEINVLLGASLIEKYWQQFGNIAVALSAYNAGPGMASTWLNKNEGAPIDTYLAKVSFKETRHYLESVLGSTFIYSWKEGEKGLPSLAITTIATAKNIKARQ